VGNGPEKALGIAFGEGAKNSWVSHGFDKVDFTRDGSGSDPYRCKTEHRDKERECDALRTMSPVVLYLQIDALHCYNQIYA
jgi:hypothetical protein